MNGSGDPALLVVDPRGLVGDHPRGPGWRRGCGRWRDRSRWVGRKEGHAGRRWGVHNSPGWTLPKTGAWSRPSPPWRVGRRENSGWCRNCRRPLSGCSRRRSRWSAASAPMIGAACAAGAGTTQWSSVLAAGARQVLAGKQWRTSLTSGRGARLGWPLLSGDHREKTSGRSARLVRGPVNRVWSLLSGDHREKTGCVEHEQQNQTKLGIPQLNLGYWMSLHRKRRQTRTGRGWNLANLHFAGS